MWWKSVLAFYAILPAAATVYFVVLWCWFDYWRHHRPLALLLVGVVFSGLGVVELVGRSWTFARELHPGAVVQGCGWALIAVSSALGTVADRQIGFRVRSFTPFFDAHGHLELKTTGAYGVVRHPIYAAGSAFQLGVPRHRLPLGGNCVGDLHRRSALVHATGGIPAGRTAR